MANRTELQQIANLRLREAQALFAAGLYDGCVYLCGYVVELALKACICRLLNQNDYLDSHTNLGRAFRSHDFDDLAILAGIQSELSSGTHPGLYANWIIATAWKPKLRYEPPGSYRQTDAQQILDSLVEIPDGVLTWLSQRW